MSSERRYLNVICIRELPKQHYLAGISLTQGYFAYCCTSDLSLYDVAESNSKMDAIWYIVA